MPYTGQYTCVNGHTTEAFYPDRRAYDKVLELKIAACSTCGSTEVSRNLVAPRVNRGISRTPAARRVEIAGQLLTDVGKAVAQVIRDMHDGTSEHTAVIGVATREEVKGLIRDEIPFGILAGPTLN